MEPIAILDENRNRIGVSHAPEIWEKGYWHETVHVWLYNGKDKILLQRRSQNKTLAPSTWDTAAAGHIADGETPVKAGLRELQEELGIKKNEEDLQFLFIRKTSMEVPGVGINNEFIHTYAIRWDGNIEELDLQEEEVDEVKWFLPAEIKELVEHPTEQDAPAHTGDYFLSAVDAIQQL